MTQICWVPHPINHIGISRLEDSGFTVIRGECPDDPALHSLITAAIFRSGKFTSTMMGQFPALKVIAVHGTGTDGIDLRAATERGIVVLNTPGMNSRSVAEHAMALLFALAKRITIADQAVRNNEYTSVKYLGGFQEIMGMSLGVIGYGATGQILSRLATGLGMTVRVFSSQPAETINLAGCIKAASLESLLRESDYVSLHAPSTPKTKHLINADRLALMKPGACLINTSRGALVDENALAEALRHGKLAGAGLDVFEQEPLPVDSPLMSAPNIILTPHTAASTESAMRNMALAAVQGILDVVNHQRPSSLVNPAVWPER